MSQKKFHFRTTFVVKILRALFAVFIVLFLTYAVVSLTTTPSNSRNWTLDQSVLPYARIDGPLVTIFNIRNFTYASTTSYTPNYYDKTYNLSKIKKVWYIVEPFEGVPGSAHTFLSFEFEDDIFVSISIEIRKEQGESFHPLKGLFNQYEITYVVADEQDAVKLRSNFRKDIVYLYPTVLSKEKSSALFMDMISRINSLYINPEFYNTITNNCTTNIVKHINSVLPDAMNTFNIEAIFPEYSDKLAYDLGFIDTTLPFEQIRDFYRINEKASTVKEGQNFSIQIRK